MKRFHPLRFLVIVVLLIGVAIYVQEQRLRTTSWIQPLHVTVFPINGDGSAMTARHIRDLDASTFDAIGRFMAREAQRYGVRLEQPMVVRRGPELAQLPPDPPRPDEPLWKRLAWTLLFRVWAWHYTPDDTSNFRRIRVFAVYHGKGEETALPHSLGIQKGLLGLVHLFADPAMKTRNDIVMAHEILHTVGATDKYTPEGRPVIPDGLADPRQEPLFPQRRAEIMAGSIALDTNRSTSPNGLRQCVVGPLSAREVGWIEEG